jgi:hypothetical protein
MTVNQEWHPDTGWYLPIIACLFVIIAVTLQVSALLWERRMSGEAYEVRVEEYIPPGYGEPYPHIRYAEPPPSCPVCGYLLRYIDIYSAWYCDQCGRYYR